jgi:hypothetical protein
VKFYRVHRTQYAGENAGYEWFTVKRLAQEACSDWLKQGEELGYRAYIDVVEIEPTKQGIQQALNRYASHADNG